VRLRYETRSGGKAVTEGSCEAWIGFDWVVLKIPAASYLWRMMK